jgi:diguanylate cyclase (GGDEF)-like protein/PAS domain S-box-containing protein
MNQTAQSVRIPYDELVRQLVVPTFVVGADCRVLAWNQSCELLTGMRAEEVVGTSEHWRAFYDHPRPCLADLIIHGETARIEELYAASDNSLSFYGGLHVENWCTMPLRGIDLYLSIDASHLRNERGELIAVIETLRDWTDWKTSEARLRLIESVFNSSSEGIVITDARARIVDVNPAYSRLTGYAVDEARGRSPRLLQSGMHEREFYRRFWYALKTEGQWSGEIWDRRKDGELYPAYLNVNAVRNANGETTHYVGMFNDITAQKRAQERLEDMANHDALTGLPNRIALSVRLHQVLAAARGRNKLVAVCFVDLDNFKPINDNFGHEAGDSVLIEIAQRLKAVIRASDTVARIGGDEFVMLLSEFSNMDEIELTLDRILDVLRNPVSLGENKAVVSASIGVTVHPFDECDTDTLIRHADQAMYCAKNMGRNTWHMYDSTDDRATLQTSSLLSLVREGLLHGEFRLHYQPKVNLRTGRIVGMEALIRWLHPERGLVSPGEFLPAIEKSPLIVDLGEWVLHEALAQIARWRNQGLDMTVSVNIAARQFQHIDFVLRLRGILAEYPEVPAHLLEIEVLESTALDDVENVRAVILACQDMGVGFALDDFGTGYSTLTYLKRLPARELKIDQTFIRDMLDDREDLALVEGVIGLASVFNMDVIAEGVETLEQGIVLMRIGCDVVQGYYIARPMPGEQVPAWVAAFKPDAAWSRWAGAAWDRSHLPLVLAEYDHIKWVQRLVTAMDDQAVDLSAEEVADPLGCRFGQWYADEGRRQYGHLRAFVDIEPIHLRAHELAREMVCLRDAGQTDGARSRIGELNHLKDTIVDRLGALHGHLLHGSDTLLTG